MSTEADTCRVYVTPRLQHAGWANDQIAEQATFTDGRILVTGGTPRRGKPKRADYLLRYQPDYLLAVVEAKSDEHQPGDGMQQAKDYAQALDVFFAYATNGPGILEYDFSTGTERALDAFPSPAELWRRYRAARGLPDALEDQLLVPGHVSDKVPRYYQRIAINRAVEAILQGERRVLLTLATGTGKTVIAFQIAWRLWNARWNARGLPQQRPRILFLADRSFLVDDPKDKDFAPFGDARHKIAHGQAVKSREMYFATYQAIARDEARPGLYRDYPPDFFDLIIVDEAHRGSARDDSSWREILEYFTGAVQLGMTATPRRADNIDTYAYFGNPVYTYSLKQGIQDGFLAPYQVRRIVTDIDTTGFRPYAGQRDAYGREIPDQEYSTRDFERVISIRARTEAVARHLTTYLKSTDRFAKTLVFCVDQEHADQMRQALANANADLMAKHPSYVARVTADEGEIGKGLLSTFQDVETKTPVILTTSRLLTTGVDAPLVKNVVLFRIVNSMTDFKQIIGRGTRVRADYGKLFFTILDYTGSATKNFADPVFDGEPVLATEEEIDAAGNTTSAITLDVPPEDAGDPNSASDQPFVYPVPPAQPNWKGRFAETERRKFYLPNGITVEIVHEMVQQLDAAGRRLQLVQLTDYTGDQVRGLYRTADDLRRSWTSSASRAAIVAALEERGITLEHLAAIMDQPDADPFDLLCHLAFHAPLHTRRDRANRVRKEKRDFFARYAAPARAILDAILDQYATHGPAEIVLPDVLRLPAIANRGSVGEIAGFFGGPEQLRDAVTELQTLLYAA